MLILNFHGVGTIPREIDQGEYDCWLESDFFNEVLDLLSGYPDVKLTVDDGNRSDVEIILPALLARGLTASFFVVTSRFDQPYFLTSGHIQELLGNGMQIGSHGMRHCPWRHLPEKELKEELVDARDQLNEVSGQVIREAACPFGSYSWRVLRALKEAGYTAVYTSDGGRASQGAWLLPRVTIRRSMPLDYIRFILQNRPGMAARVLQRTRTFIKRLR